MRTEKSIVSVANVLAGHDIEAYLQQFQALGVFRYLATRAPKGHQFMKRSGLPSKISVCVGPHKQSNKHVVVSNADNFHGLGFENANSWAREAFEARKERHHAANQASRRLLNRFYDTCTAGPRPDPVKLWNFVTNWTSTSAPPTDQGCTFNAHLTETAATFDVAAARQGLEVCARCNKCRAIHQYLQSREGIKAECEFPGALTNTGQYRSGSCAEDLLHLLCTSCNNT